MHDSCRFQCVIAFVSAALLITLTSGPRAQALARVAQIPGIDPEPCNPGPEERPWLNPNQTPGCRALEAIASMTLEEKLAELGGRRASEATERI
jgi:hypothetical protein